MIYSGGPFLVQQQYLDKVCSGYLESFFTATIFIKSAPYGDWKGM